MVSPFNASGIGILDHFTFHLKMKERREACWQDIHIAPRVAPSVGAKSCTYHRWFGRPPKIMFEPYYELPLSMSKLRLLMQFRMGSHSLPIEQGRFVRPPLPRHLRRCTHCRTLAIGDERHYLFDCPHFAHIRARFDPLFRMLMDPCAPLFGTRIK